MENYIQITITLKDDDPAGVLIAQLSELGFEGFEEEPSYIHAFIDEKKIFADDLEKIISANGLVYTKKYLPKKNWNEEWEKNFEPVIIGDFCAIRAFFHAPIADAKHEIIITPKMSFGTGHHATTYLMVKATGAIDFKNKTVLDFGTGTGILAILAAKCGANKVVGIDNDDWSIENAMENIKENDCSKISVQKDDSIAQTGVFDIILANINKNIILEHFNSFKQHLLAGGVLILSGLLSEDLADIEAEADKNRFRILSKLEKENWICLVLKLVQA